MCKVIQNLVITKYKLNKYTKLKGLNTFARQFNMCLNISGDKMCLNEFY